MKDQLAQYGEVLEHVSLKNYNTFRVGGTCRFMIFPTKNEDLQHLIQFLNQENILYFVLGNGSNVILSEREFPGVVILLKKMDALEIVDTKVRVGAGQMMPKLAMDRWRMYLWKCRSL